jgi:hypothetical protein
MSRMGDITVKAEDETERRKATDGIISSLECRA